MSKRSIRKVREHTPAKSFKVRSLAGQRGDTQKDDWSVFITNPNDDMPPFNPAHAEEHDKLVGLFGNEQDA